MIAQDSTTIRVRTRTRRLLKLMSARGDVRAIDIIERLVEQEWKREQEQEQQGILAGPLTHERQQMLG